MLVSRCAVSQLPIHILLAKTYRFMSTGCLTLSNLSPALCAFKMLPLITPLYLSCLLTPSLNRVCGHQNELQQPVNDVPGWREQSRLEWGGLEAFHAAPSGWPGLLQHPEGHRLCQDDPRLQVQTTCTSVTEFNFTLLTYRYCVAACIAVCHSVSVCVLI